MSRLVFLKKLLCVVIVAKRVNISDFKFTLPTRQNFLPQICIFWAQENPLFTFDRRRFNDFSDCAANKARSTSDNYFFGHLKAAADKIMKTSFMNFLALYRWKVFTFHWIGRPGRFDHWNENFSTVLRSNLKKALRNLWFFYWLSQQFFGRKSLLMYEI